MTRFLFSCIAALALAACNNNASTTGRTDSLVRPASTAAGIPADPTARDASFSFIDGCIESTRLTLGDQKAFAFCKCIYGQLQAQYPGADSVAMQNLMADTARVNKLAAACR